MNYRRLIGGKCVPSRKKNSVKTQECNKEQIRTWGKSANYELNLSACAKEHLIGQACTYIPVFSNTWQVFRNPV